MSNINRNLPVISTALLSYVQEQRLLVGEMSTLQGNGLLAFGRVFMDACDEGLTLRSARTGREVPFAVSHVERGEDGLLYWDLTPVTETGRVAYDCRLRIFND
jgi:hypothetical protein